MRNLRDDVRTSLVVVGLVAAATLFRSVLFGKWTTVVAALALIGGAGAALRGRTWGVGVSFALATAFVGAAMMGFAPPWFTLVGVAATLPLVLTLRPMAQFDAGATALFAALAAATGVAGTFAWREVAYALFVALH